MTEKKKGWDSTVEEGGKKEWKGEGRKIDKRHANRQTELKRQKKDHLPGIHEIGELPVLFLPT